LLPPPPPPLPVEAATPTAGPLALEPVATTATFLAAMGFGDAITTGSAGIRTSSSKWETPIGGIANGSLSIISKKEKIGSSN